MTPTELQVLINDFRNKSNEVVAREWLGKAEYTVESYKKGVHLHLRVYDYEVHNTVEYLVITQSKLDVLGYIFEEMVHAMKKVTHEIHNPSKRA